MGNGGLHGPFFRCVYEKANSIAEDGLCVLDHGPVRSLAASWSLYGVILLVDFGVSGFERNDR